MSDVGSHVLLFSPDLEGHREVYCRVVAALLTRLGCCVSVAGRLGRGRGSLEAVYPQLAAAARESGAGIFDVGDDPREGPAIDRRRLLRRLRQVGADTIVLMEADAYLPLLAGGSLRGHHLMGRRRRERVVGVFVRSTNYIYEPPPRGGGGVRRAVAHARAARHGHVDRRLFHETLVPRGWGVDSALCLDERFVALYGGRHGWLPDIFAGPDLEAGAAEEPRRWAARLDAVLADHPGAPVVVYTGWADPRRGYLELLSLAETVGGVFLHCGETLAADEPEAAAAGDVRRRLAAGGRLLETGSYYRSAATAAEFLRRAHCVVLPYRHHLGSSGAMLQALAAGRPVIVPDEGLMAWRVRSYGLGATYRPLDAPEMTLRFRQLDGTGAPPYRPAVNAYMHAFRDAQRLEALRWAVLGEGRGALLPGRVAEEEASC